MTLSAALALVLAGAVTLLVGGELWSPEPTPPLSAPALRTAAPAPSVPTVPARPQLLVPRAVPPPADIITSAVPAEDPAAAGPPPRIVGGPGISPGPVGHGRMEREAPPQQPEAEAAVDSGPAWQPFTQVVVIGAGTLNLGGRKVQLAGIAPPESGLRCRASAGPETFECAFLAMQALRQRLRARGVECRLARLETIGTEPAACRIGTTDLSQWLLDQGWAMAAADAPEAYRTAEDAARCANAGLWAEAPRPDSCPPR
jgi:endonuclease YncB( thermonuclease family)